MSEELVRRARATPLYEGSGEESDLGELMAARIAELEAERDRAEALLNEAVEALRHAYETLIELNISNYDHDDVCRMNDASVEVLLAVGAFLARVQEGRR